MAFGSASVILIPLCRLFFNLEDALRNCVPDELLKQRRVDALDLLDDLAILVDRKEWLRSERLLLKPGNELCIHLHEGRVEPPSRAKRPMEGKAAVAAPKAKVARQSKVRA